MNLIPTATIPRAHVLPFAIFLYVADADSRIGATEVECFRKLIEKRDWCQSNITRNALESISQDYTQLWKSYASGEFKSNPSVLNHELDRWHEFLQKEEINGVHQDLITIAQSIRNLGSIPRRKRSQAIDEILRFLKKERASNHISVRNVSDGKVPFSSEPPVWKEGRIELRCTKVVHETADTKTFSFVADSRCLFWYKPGQFITLELEIDGKIIERSYTISSSPSRPYNLSITVKLIDSGLVSSWLHTHLVPGKKISAIGPFGKFNCHDYPSDKYLFFAAGSGITPVISMVRWLVDTDPESDITVLYTSREQADFIFLDELLSLNRSHPKFKLALFCTRPTSGWYGYTGKISQEICKLVVPDFQDREVFVCGPSSYMQQVKSILGSLNFPLTRFHLESFGTQENTKAETPNSRIQTEEQPKVPVKPSEAPTTYKIAFSRSGVEAVCNESDCILDEARKNNIFIPSGCRIGECGRCKVLKLSGAVHMECDNGLTQTEIEEGYILPCVAKARGAVNLDI